MPIPKVYSQSYLHRNFEERGRRWGGIRKAHEIFKVECWTIHNKLRRIQSKHVNIHLKLLRIKKFIHLKLLFVLAAFAKTYMDRHVKSKLKS